MDYNETVRGAPTRRSMGLWMPIGYDEQPVTLQQRQTDRVLMGAGAKGL